MSTTLAPETVIPAVSPPDEAAIVLEQAADLIERVGWWDGVHTRFHVGPTHPKCVALAINHVCDTNGLSGYEASNLNFEARKRFRLHLGLDDKAGSIPRWNDAQKDGRVVVRALREAASS